MWAPQRGVPCAPPCLKPLPAITKRLYELPRVMDWAQGANQDFEHGGGQAASGGAVVGRHPRHAVASPPTPWIMS